MNPNKILSNQFCQAAMQAVVNMILEKCHENRYQYKASLFKRHFGIDGYAERVAQLSALYIPFYTHSRHLEPNNLGAREAAEIFLHIFADMLTNMENTTRIDEPSDFFKRVCISMNFQFIGRDNMLHRILTVADTIAPFAESALPLAPVSLDFVKEPLCRFSDKQVELMIFMYICLLRECLYSNPSYVEDTRTGGLHFLSDSYFQESQEPVELKIRRFQHLTRQYHAADILEDLLETMSLWGLREWFEQHDVEHVRKQMNDWLPIYAAYYEELSKENYSRLYKLGEKREQYEVVSFKIEWDDYNSYENYDEQYDMLTADVFKQISIPQSIGKTICLRDKWMLGAEYIEVTFNKLNEIVHNENAKTIQLEMKIFIHNKDYRLWDVCDLVAWNHNHKKA